MILCNSVFAQLSGVVMDEITSRPIPYVNIHIAGSQSGFTSNQNGMFLINANQSDTAIFSAVGFESKNLQIGLIKNEVFLTPKVYEIEEVTIQKHEKVYSQIGKLKRQFPSYHYGNSTGRLLIIGQLIPYEDKIEQTPYLKSIEFLTHSDVKNAKFNVRLYNLNRQGEPDQLIYGNNIIAIARKGGHKTKVSLDSLHIKFPTSGLVVGIEWFNIEENKYEYSYTMKGSAKKLKTTSIEPNFSLDKNAQKTTHWFYWNNWHKVSNHIKPIQMELILTNL